MSARLKVDEKEIPLKPFVEEFITNVTKGILASLKGTRGAKRASFRMEGKVVELVADGLSVDLHTGKGFAGILVRDTLLGMTSHLKGMGKWGTLLLEVELD